MINKNWGRIIHVSSIRVASGTLSYSTTKHGLIGMSKVLAKEYAKFNITSNVISLGYFDTKMWKSLKSNIKKDLLEKQLGHSVDHFSYPFGTANDAGISTGITTTRSIVIMTTFKIFSGG